MLTILHISDVHFGPFYVSAVGEALLKIAPELKPDIIVVSGDFTQRAKRHQFAEAREFLNQLPKAPTIVTPGNHDVALYRIWERWFHPYDLYQEFIHKELDYVFKRDDVMIVSLNSTSPRRTIVDGRLERWQLDFTAEAFAGAAPGALKIVVAHHHFAPAPDYERKGDTMIHGKRALERFEELGVDLIMGGHLHRAYIGNSLDVFPGPRRDKGVIIVQSGTSTSRRGRAREAEKNSFNLLRVSDDLIRITHYMHFEEAGGFAPASLHTFPRGANQFFDPQAA